MTDTYTNWEDVPEHLKTRSALKKRGLKPKRGQQPVAVKTHWHWKTPDYALYDMREAVPNTVTDKQKAALEKARQESLAKRTCKNCGRVEELSRDYRGKVYVRNGLCDRCMDDLLRQSRIDEAHDEAVGEARALLKVQGTLILDTETADLDGEIIELAIMTLDGEPVYNSRFRPSERISEGARKVHGLTAEALADAPLFAEEHPKIKAILEAAPKVLIYNAAFDAGRLNYTCSLYKLPDIELETTCLMELYAEYVGDWSEYHGSFRWQPLLGGDHTALGDCRAALTVLQRMAEGDDGEAEG